MSGGFEDGADVLEEVELFVGGGRKEVLAVIGEVFFFLFTVFVGDGGGAFFAKGGISQDVVVAMAFVGDQGVVAGDGDGTVDFADVVEEHVHQAEATGAGDDFVSSEGIKFEEFLLVFVEGVVFGVVEKVVGGEEESAGTAGGICDRLSGLGTDAFDHGAD